MNTQLLFETHITSMQLKNDQFMKKYMETIIPILESNDLQLLHHKIKEMTRDSELTVMPRSGLILEKITSKAKISLSEQFHPLVEHICDIGTTHDKAAAISIALLTTALVENNNRDHVLSTGIKSLHRAFITEQSIPNGFKFTTDAGITLHKTDDEWYYSDGREVSDEIKPQVQKMAQKHYEASKSKIDDDQASSGESDELFVVTQFEDDDENTWTLASDENWYVRSPDADPIKVEDTDTIEQLNAYVSSLEDAEEINDNEDIETSEISNDEFELTEPVKKDTGPQKPESNDQSKIDTDDNQLELDFDANTPEESEKRTKKSQKPKQIKTPKSLDDLKGKQFQFTAPNGTELFWKGNQWQYKNPNDKFVPVPKKFKDKVQKIAKLHIENLNAEIEAQKREQEEATRKEKEKKEQELASKFDFGVDFEDETKVPEIPDYTEDGSVPWDYQKSLFDYPSKTSYQKKEEPKKSPDQEELQIDPDWKKSRTPLPGSVKDEEPEQQEKEEATIDPLWKTERKPLPGSSSIKEPEKEKAQISPIWKAERESIPGIKTQEKHTKDSSVLNKREELFQQIKNKLSKG